MDSNCFEITRQTKYPSASSLCHEPANTRAAHQTRIFTEITNKTVTKSNNSSKINSISKQTANKTVSKSKQKLKVPKSKQNSFKIKIVPKSITITKSQNQNKLQTITHHHSSVIKQQV
jgi:hypothetical protein